MDCWISGLMDCWTNPALCSTRLWPINPLIHQSNNPVLGLVVPAGNAPASSGYQPGALLLSYETVADGVGMGFPSLTRWMPHVTLFASRIVMHPRSPEARSVFGTGALL